MALPVLDATFASAADLPRRQMLARWLVEELGSGSIADYYSLPERYLWAKIAVAAGATRPEEDYVFLPKNYVWSDIYNAVASDSGSHIDWSEKQALGHIAAAYRGDTANPEALATYIDWPWRYQVASIIGGVGPAFPSAGLLAFWKLADLTDASGNGNALINTNGVTFVAGKIGNAADFNSSYLSTGGNFTWGNYWSVSLWFRADSETFLDAVFDASSTGGGPVIDLDNGDIRFNDALQVIGTAPYTLEQWTHVVITRSDSDASLIVNGGTPASFEWFEGPKSFPIWLGNSQGASGRFFDGQIDAVGVWNRTLTNQEILQLYNNGNGVEP